MNALEQREHRTVTRALQQQIDDLVAIVSALESQQATIYGEAVEAMAAERTARLAMMERLRESIGEEHTHRLKLAQEQRTYVDQEDRELRRRIERLEMTWWRRMRSLLWSMGLVR